MLISETKGNGIEYVVEAISNGLEQCIPIIIIADNCASLNESTRFSTTLDSDILGVSSVLL